MRVPSLRTSHRDDANKRTDWHAKCKIKKHIKPHISSCTHLVAFRMRFCLAAFASACVLACSGCTASVVGEGEEGGTGGGRSGAMRILN